MVERTQDEVMSGIEFLLDELDTICRNAVATYRRYGAEFLIEHDTRAAATCTYCHMYAEAERRFAGRAGIAPLEVRGLKVWAVGEGAVIRFKKMDEDGRSRNYPTKQAQDYDRGVTLPGLPLPAARLVVGYLLDPTGTEVLRVQVAKPAGKSIDWCAAIVAGDDVREGAPRWIDVTRQARAI
jgi:hypothetical protein